MKKAFTLIEMMIVVLIIAVLMSIMFRIGNMGTESEAKIVTILRLQKLENCLSGFNACFGTYPPVPVQGSRSIYSAVSDHGVQVAGSKSTDVWSAGSQEKRSTQFTAACKAQPVEIMFPWSVTKKEYVDAIGDEMSRRSRSRAEEYMNYWGDPIRARILDANYDAGSPDRFKQNRDQYDWRNIQLFKFGLLSFLLPRYLVMMNGEKAYYTEFKQWTANNTVPCDPFTGRTFGSWGAVWETADSAQWAGEKDSSQENWSSRAQLAAIPSQAACARWMPNLEGIIRTNKESDEAIYLYGIYIDDNVQPRENPNMRFHVANEKVASDGKYEGLIFSPYPPSATPGGDSVTDQYCLDRMTVLDGWGHTFYYYSPSPYQTYQLWSGGANNQTFPPWISRKKLSSAQNQMVAEMVKDDIIRLSK